MDNTYLTIVSDEVTMTPEFFKNLLSKYKHHRNIKFGFSKKHTEDIQNYRKKLGLAKNESSIPSNLYNLPVTWNCDTTYVK